MSTMDLQGASTRARAPVLYVEPGRPRSPPFAAVPGLESLDQDELCAADFAGWRGVILPMHVDQRRFAAGADAIAGWLARGGRLYVGGNTNYPLLPGLAPFRRVEHVTPAQLGITVVDVHPVLDTLPPEVAQANAGVQGFYARGHVPPLPGARVLRLIGGRFPVDWELAWPGRGRLLVHAGNDPWTTGDDPARQVAFAHALVNWLAGDD
ncbi:MAG: hypothetical protein MUF07_02300 [Steroidobacteraceae bacterium]|jgi:hypothetical protein|nr:hypothetical protein [Steroidobacteraceae bacterium]